MPRGDGWLGAECFILNSQGGGSECFIEDSHEAMFKTLDDA